MTEFIPAGRKKRKRSRNWRYRRLPPFRCFFSFYFRFVVLFVLKKKKIEEREEKKIAFNVLDFILHEVQAKRKESKRLRYVSLFGQLLLFRRFDFEWISALLFSFFWGGWGRSRLPIVPQVGLLTSLIPLFSSSELSFTTAAVCILLFPLLFFLPDREREENYPILLLR